LTISVVISTRNRSDTLRETLARMTRMRIPRGVEWEVVVVDNGSGDDTPEVVESFRDLLPLRASVEPRSGASRGRNLGIRAARGDVVAFTDDDCYVAKGWLEAIHREFSGDSDLAVLGGRVELYDPRDQEVTVRTYEERIPLVSEGQLFALIPGCNMAIRSRVFERVGGFDERLGPGVRAPAAEDVDLVYRAFREGMKALYVPEMLVYHDHGRRTPEEVARLHRGYRLGRGAFYCKHILEGDRAILRRARWEVQSLVRDLLGRPRGENAGEPVAEPGRALKELGLGAAARLIPSRAGRAAPPPPPPSSGRRPGGPPAGGRAGPPPPPRRSPRPGPGR
jgi:GT2 family glycosyltransferase